MRSKIQTAWLSALETILRPLIRLWLQSGLGYAEFSSIAKSVFVQVASDDYSHRSRPANFSQVSAMTGISRKEVSRIRRARSESRWTPDMESSPLNTILHNWHFDPDFSDGLGKPNEIPLEGQKSFATLVNRYAGDIPPGAIRAALEKGGIVDQTPGGALVPRQAFFYSRQFDPDFVRGLAFSLGGMGSTLVHNSALSQRSDISLGRKQELARLERTAWTEHLDRGAAQSFKAWVDVAGPAFLAEAHRFIGERELPRESWSDSPPRVIGVGVYYFEED